MGLISRVSSRTYRNQTLTSHSNLDKMPRGRPVSKEKAVAKKAEEERQANLTQEELEAEKEKAIEVRAAEKAQKALDKAERAEVFKAAAEAQREKVRNMSEAEKKKFYAKNAEKGNNKRKRIQGDLIFPVKTIKKNLKGMFGMKKVYKNNRSEGTNITLESAIFTAAVIEYLTAEVLELSGECSKQMRKTRIVPRHIMSAVRMDEELNVLFPRSTTIASAGVLPKPMPAFLTKNNVPRSQWTAGPSEIFRPTSISAPSSKSVKSSGEINNNKKKIQKKYKNQLFSQLKTKQKAVFTA